MRKKKKAGLARIKAIVKSGYHPNSVGAHRQEVAKLTLRMALAAKKKKIKRRAFGGGGNRQTNLAAKRFANDRARALKKYLVVRPKSLWSDRSYLMRDRTPSQILDNLDPQRPLKWKKVLARRYKREFPRIKLSCLNFLDAPVDTINNLIELSRAEREEVNAYLDFEDSYCLDIGAFLVIAEIWPQLSHIFRGGRMTIPVQKVLDAVGIGRDLNNILLHSVKDHKDIWPFEIRRRRPRGSTQSDTAQLKPQGREQLNDKLIELMDEWLMVASRHVESDGDEPPWELSGDGRANIANMIGEILDNAERHSTGDGDGDWSMAAFMAKREIDGVAQMKCYLAFLSVGHTIAETLANAPPEMQNFCNQYASAHVRPGQSLETLITIAALQDGITSVHDAAANRRGGTGLQDTLEFVGDLGGVPRKEADVKVTIVSGKSCIRLRHPVLVGRRDGNNRRVQWCNEANNPLYPPDDNVAFDLPAHFAGTLVTVAFTLNPTLFVPEDDENEPEND